MEEHCTSNLFSFWLAAKRRPKKNLGLHLLKNNSDSNPDNWTPSCPSDIEIDWDDVESIYRPDPEEEVDPQLYEELQQDQWEKLRKVVQRQPDPFKEINYETKHSQRLFDKFKESGLQIIVKMATIELTPSKPVFPAGSWHVSRGVPHCPFDLYSPFYVSTRLKDR